MFARIVGRKGLVGIAVGALGAGVAYGAWKGSQNGGQMSSTPVGVVFASSGHSSHHTRRQARFEKFASCEMNGHYLMTPADFLESLMHQDLPGIQLTYCKLITYIRVHIADLPVSNNAGYVHI